MRVQGITRLLIIGGAATLAGVLVTLACSSPAGTPYGNPNTLDRKNIPGEGGVEPLTCLTGDAGGGGRDGGCSVSFAKDIYPYFADAGGCALAACHAAGKSSPTIDVTAPDKLYASLQGASAAKTPYLPAATGDGGSSLICNLRGECGRKMPEGQGKDPTADELCKMQAWLACGAPLN